MQLTARTVITVLSFGLVSTPNAGAGSPPTADGQLETEHFRVVYFKSEFSVEEAALLGRVLEAEVHREHGDTRLAYLAQGSFCKFLDRFISPARSPVEESPPQRH